MKLIHKSRQEIDHMATGGAARQERNKSGLSLRECARRMGFKGPSYLSDLELGRRNWTAELVSRFTKAVKRSESL